MSYLIDTSIFLCARDQQSALREVCALAVQHLVENEQRLFICTQVLAEYWVVATRPRQNNGMGLDLSTASADVGRLLAAFESLPEPDDGSRRWYDLVVRHHVLGKQVHDARLAALMLAHGVTHILTLNPGDFARYDGITPVTPQEIHQTP